MAGCQTDGRGPKRIGAARSPRAGDPWAAWLQQAINQTLALSTDDLVGRPLVAEGLGVSLDVLNKYAQPSHFVTPPASTLVAMLGSAALSERAAQHLLGALAGLAGCVVVPLPAPTGTEEPPERAVVRQGEALGALCQTVLAAVGADSIGGVAITREEAREALARVRRLEQTTAELRAGLEAIVEGGA